MRRTNLWKGLLSLVLCICMVLALLPGVPLTADAATVSVPTGYTSYNIEAADYPVDQFGERYLSISKNGSYCIYGTKTQVGTHIIVESGVTATIILDDVSIKTSENGTASALALESGANVTLKLVGYNEMIGGLHQAAVEVPENSSLTITSIDGDGSIAGTLVATALPYPINSSNYLHMSNVMGVGGAGIGADGLSHNGVDYTSSLGSITINGGTVHATGATGGAGIGGAGKSITGSITINGGDIIASVDDTSDYASGAAIGGSAMAYVPSISINGGSVNARYTYGGANIGAGWNSDALSTDMDYYHYGDITITGGNVYTYGSKYDADNIGRGAVTGDGAYMFTGSVTITGGSIFASTITEPKNAAGVALIQNYYHDPYNSSSLPVRALTLSDGSSYGIKDVKSDNSALFLWLPEGVEVSGVTYDTSDVEAYWGSSATDAPFSGSLSTAIKKAEEGSGSTKYIRLNKDHTGIIMPSRGCFTLDLNGKTLTGGLYLAGLNISVTLTDSAGGGKITSNNSPAIQLAYGSTVTINGGSYHGSGALYVDNGCSAVVTGGRLSTNNRYVICNDGSLTVSGGTLAGGSEYSVSANGTTTLAGVTYEDTPDCTIYYRGGALDLSDVSNAGIFLTNATGKTVSADQIKIPAGCVFVDSTTNSPAPELRDFGQYHIGPIPPHFVISFDANGGSGSMDSAVVYEGHQSYLLPACGFTAPAGKVFLGWSYSSDGELIEPDWVGQIEITQDTTLYAQWTNQQAAWGTDENHLTSVGTLSQAAEAEDGQYIKVLNDCSITDTVYIDKDVTLDLNGKTVTEGDNIYQIFYVKSGTLTLTDSAGGAKVECLGENSGKCIYVSSGAKLTIHGGRFYSATGSVLQTDSGTEALITGGDFSTSHNYVVGNDGKLTVSGGNFTAGKWFAITTGGTLILNGGSFTAGENGTVGYYGGVLDVSGHPDPLGISMKNYDRANLPFPSGQVTVTLSDGNILLPAGYAVMDTNGTAVTELVYDTLYTVGIQGTAYTVTAADGNNGRVSVDKAQAGAGMTVTVTVTPGENYRLDTLTISGGVTPSKVSDNVYTFTMPSENVTVTATFRPEHDCDFTNNGFCPYGCYEPAVDSNGDGYVEIDNGGQLFWFAQNINNGTIARNSNAVLTADIDLEGRAWTPICSTGLYYNTTSYDAFGYTGTFDGQGYAISNLSITGTTGDASFGLFGTLSGTVKKLGINSFTFTGAGGDTRVGAVVGQMLNDSLVENCFAVHGNINTKVNTEKGVAGGIAGCNYAATIRNCFVSDLTISAGRDGGIVGDNRADGGATDRQGTIENCYTSYGSLHHSTMAGSGATGETGITADRFASGEVAYKLNGDQSNIVWKQTIGEDSLPGFTGKTVNYGFTTCHSNQPEAIYSNDQLRVEKPEHEAEWDDGTCMTAVLCSICGDVVTAAKEEHYFVNGECDNPGCDVFQTFRMTYYVNGEKVDTSTYTSGVGYWPKLEGYTYGDKNAEGLTFVGWSLTEGGVVCNEALWPDSDMNFYAVYKKQYTITYYTYNIDIPGYNEDGDVFTGAGEVTLYTNYSNYYKIVGWDADGDGKADYECGEQITLTADMALYEVVVPFSATIDLGAEDAVYDITEVVGEMPYSIVTLTTFPVRPGYIFLGFVDNDYYGYEYPIYTDEETGETYIEIALLADGLTLVAMWEECTEHNWLDATCTEPKTCTVCGKTEGEPLGHSYESFVCTVCGHVPVKLETAALSFKEKIHYNIFFSLEIDETIELSDMGLIMFDSLKADGTVDDAIATYSGAVEIEGKYMVATEGVPAKCMGDTIYFRAYVRLADGSYVYSKTVQYSAVAYAEHILAGDEPESAKALVVAMLNYGAAAQMFFGYNTDNPVNEFLTDEQKALPEKYRDDMVNTVPVVAAEKQGVFANNKGFSKRMPAVSFEGAFEINYFFTPAYVPVDGITLYYWTEADFDANEVLTVDNATGSLKLEGTGMEQYRGDIGGIAAKNLSENIYVAAVYSDGTTTWTSGVLGYSIGAYCGSLATKGGAMADLAMATAVYGYHAKQYFG